MFISVSEARASLNRLISSGETALITKNEKTEAVLLTYDEYIKLLSNQHDLSRFDIVESKELSFTDYIKTIIKKEFCKLRQDKLRQILSFQERLLNDEISNSDFHNNV